MQVVILAAGQSSRFYPFTNLPHKSFTKLLGKTLLEHTIVSIKESGITDIIIVTGSNTLIKDTIGDGKNYGVTITYVVQPEPLGMGDALLRVKEYIKDSFYLLNAHHADFSEFKKLLQDKKKKDEEVVLLAQHEVHVEKYGILKIDGDRVLEIVEKPKKEKAPSDLKVIGIYLLHKAFFTILEQQPLAHYNFEDALTQYAKESIIKYAVTEEHAVSLKYPWDVFQMGAYLVKKASPKKGKDVSIAKNVVIEGEVVIEDGVRIFEGACIKGPCYIGKNSVIGNNAIVRNGTIIGENVVIGANAEVRNVILFDNASTHSGFIGDSIIGSGSKLAANFTTGNKRIDRAVLEIEIKGKKVNSGLRSLGVILGDNVQVGISVSTMPGIIIGNDSIIGPSTTVMENIAANTTYYTEFKTVTKKRRQHGKE